MIKRPMKAPSDSIQDEQLAQIIDTYGFVIASPKLDGFRCVVDDGPKTSSLKQFPNRYVNIMLSYAKYEGFDGELVVGAYDDPAAFNNSTGPLRRIEGDPAFTFYVFDDFTNPELGYELRLKGLHDRVAALGQNHPIKLLEFKVLKSVDAALQYEADCLEAGFEGIMLRVPGSIYKHGRASLKQEIIYKRKAFVDIDCKIIGFVEGSHNMNEATTSEMGLTKRASNKENLVPNGTLGAFILEHSNWESSFHCGGWKGGTAPMRQEVWDNQGKYLNTCGTMKYQPHGSIDKPRLPIFLRFRPEFDTEK